MQKDYNAKLDFWYQEPLGKVVYASEQELIASYLKNRFGHYLLQVGGSRCSGYVTASPIQNKIYLSEERVSGVYDATIQAKYEDLPFQLNSVDVALVAHALESAKKPQKLLSELFHVLLPNGYLLIIGFNPVSCWKLASIFQDKSRMPWLGNWHTISKVNEWLQEVGFDIIEYNSCFFNFPTTNKTLSQHGKYLEMLGSAVLPSCGAIYAILAKKTVLSMIPLQKNRREKRHRAVVSADVTAHQIS
ncbi:MAG: methyltransferase domain-containing protein [Gammaproteobacteria bacterium]|nr:methyltransferase domain-containing protein [Gammaproteobacteria bacterium]